MSATSTRPARGDTAKFVRERERVLGGALRLPRDPEDAVEAMVEQLGSRWIVKGWLRAALDAAEAEPKYWRDHHGNRVLL